MPTNLYGPWDNFHSKNSHVVPALLKRFNQARLENLKEVVCWGTGKARREFLYVEDMASASIHVMGLDKEHYQAITDPQMSHINVGFGRDITIGELALIIAEITGFYGQIKWDCSKPDGAPIKLMCSKKLNDTGWCPSTNLRDGLGYTLDWFKNNYEENDRNM
jgi:nucleoside-diphosphate-sugar epimerase